MNRRKFYIQTLSKIIFDKNAKILVLAGGDQDFRVFLKLNFKNVTISNLDQRMKSFQYKPFNWAYQNAEALSFDDNEFDYVVINAGLHHCRSPHKVLQEMYRVCRIGFLAIDTKNSLTMKIALRLKLTYKYELPAVIANDMNFGGLNNSEIPNYIYRWEEAEIERVINCYAPFSKHNFRYFYGYSESSHINSIYVRFFIRVIILILKLFLPKQGNLFGFYVKKPDLEKDAFPWIKCRNKEISIDKEWLNKNWRKKF